jgi:AcrR family transcriptional regulator
MARPANLTKEIVTRTAVKLMAARGYHGTSMREIAKDLGVRISSLYHYYPSKQDILLSAMRETMAGLTGTVQQAMDAAGDDPVAALEAGLDAHIRFHANYPESNIVTDTEIRSLEGGNAEEIIALRDRHEALIRDAIERGVKAQQFHVVDVHVAAIGLVTMCTDVSRWYRPTGPLSVDEISHLIVQLALRGLFGS